MKTHGNTILSTGGGSDIGKALATAFVNAGNRVIICGRNPNKLAAQKRYPHCTSSSVISPMMRMLHSIGQARFLYLLSRLAPGFAETMLMKA